MEACFCHGIKKLIKKVIATFTSCSSEFISHNLYFSSCSSMKFFLIFIFVLLMSSGFVLQGHKCAQIYSNIRLITERMKQHILSRLAEVSTDTANKYYLIWTKYI